MKNLTHLLKFAPLFLLSLIPALAQPPDFQPGEVIEYALFKPEVWERGVFVRSADGGSHGVIRLKPTAAYPNGFERSVAWWQVRSIGPRPAAAAPKPAEIVKNPRPNIPVNPPVKAPPPNVAPNIPPPTPARGTGLMSQEDVLNFLETNLGPNQFQNPRRDEIKKELTELIKTRGLDFRYDTALTDFRARLSKVGTSSEIHFTLGDNFGPPTERDSLMGSWNLGKIGGRTQSVINSRIYRQGEGAVGNIGTLTLNPDGTFDWKSVSAQSTNGRWRPATHAEMKTEGGDGIVLLNAKSGYNWLVTKDRRNPNPGEWLHVSELATRQIKEFGSRN